VVKTSQSQKTVMSYSAHGHAPYILAAGLGREIGNVVVNRFPRYGEIQEHVLKKHYGKDPNIFIDEGSGRILAQIDFFGDYGDYVARNLRRGEKVRKELKDYLRSFEATSLAGERRTFSNPEISISLGARFVPDPERTFYVYPALTTEVAKRAPFQVKGVEEFVRVVHGEEIMYKRIFLPQITTFSYTSIEKLPQEVSTPPLTHMLKDEQEIPEGSVYYNLSGATGALDAEIIRAASRTNLRLYRAPEIDGPGIPTGPAIIFNKNCIGQIARAGWGTIWMCQLAGKPIMAPEFRENDDPEIFHNNKTVQSLGLGVIFESISQEVIERAVATTTKIKELNNQLLRTFGTLDGIEFVAQKMQEDRS